MRTNKRKLRFKREKRVDQEDSSQDSHSEAEDIDNYAIKIMAIQELIIEDVRPQLQKMIDTNKPMLCAEVRKIIKSMLRKIVTREVTILLQPDSELSLYLGINDILTKSLAREIGRQLTSPRSFFNKCKSINTSNNMLIDAKPEDLDAIPSTSKNVPVKIAQMPMVVSIEKPQHIKFRYIDTPHTTPSCNIRKEKMGMDNRQHCRRLERKKGRLRLGFSGEDFSSTEQLPESFLLSHNNAEMDCYSSDSFETIDISEDEDEERTNHNLYIIPHSSSKRKKNMCNTLSWEDFEYSQNEINKQHSLKPPSNTNLKSILVKTFHGEEENKLIFPSIDKSQVCLYRNYEKTSCMRSKILDTLTEITFSDSNSNISFDRDDTMVGRQCINKTKDNETISSNAESNANERNAVSFRNNFVSYIGDTKSDTQSNEDIKSYVENNEKDLFDSEVTTIFKSINSAKKLKGNQDSYDENENLRQNKVAHNIIDYSFVDETDESQKLQQTNLNAEAETTYSDARASGDTEFEKPINNEQSDTFSTASQIESIEK